MRDDIYCGRKEYKYIQITSMPLNKQGLKEIN